MTCTLLCSLYLHYKSEKMNNQGGVLKTESNVFLIVCDKRI